MWKLSGVGVGVEWSGSWGWSSVGWELGWVFCGVGFGWKLSGVGIWVCLIEVRDGAGDE